MDDEVDKLYAILASLVEFIESDEVQEVIDGANDPDIAYQAAVRMLNNYDPNWRV